MIWPPPERPLEGRKVRLEPLLERHREPLAAIADVPECWTWTDRRVPASRGAFDDWFDARLAGRAEHREHGYATLSAADGAAKRLMLGHAFGDLGAIRVELKADARNERSRGAMEALPAQFEGIHRKHMVMPVSGVRDSAYYSVTDEEWPAVKKNLEARLVRHGSEQGA